MPIDRRAFLTAAAASAFPLLAGPRTAFARRDADPAEEPTARILRPSTEANPRNTEGDLVTLSDGRWLVVWSEFYGGGRDDSAARIAGMISTDAGRSFSEPFVVQQNVGRENVMSASLLRFAGGGLALFYGQKNGRTDLRFYMRRSSDEARTWGGPVDVTPAAGYHVMNNARVIQLASGRLLAPVASTSEVWSPREHFTVSVFYSDVEGASWQRSQGRVDAPKRGAMEPGIVELADGRLLMIVRTQIGVIYRSTSEDAGDTWSEPAPLLQRPGGPAMAAPEAPATIAAIPGSDDLLLVWNHTFDAGADHGGRRTPLTSAVSSDAGASWQHVKNIEDDPDHHFHYTSVRFIDDRVALLYSQDLALELRIAPRSWFYT